MVGTTAKPRRKSPQQAPLVPSDRSLSSVVPRLERAGVARCSSLRQLPCLEKPSACLRESGSGLPFSLVPINFILHHSHVLWAWPLVCFWKYLPSVFTEKSDLIICSPMTLYAVFRSDSVIVVYKLIAVGFYDLMWCLRQCIWTRSEQWQRVFLPVWILGSAVAAPWVLLLVSSMQTRPGKRVETFSVQK